MKAFVIIFRLIFASNVLAESTPDEQIQKYTEAIKADPVNYSNYDLLAKQYIDQKDYSQAIETLNKCIAKVKNEDRAYMLRGWCKLQKGENKEFVFEDYNKAIKINPNKAKYYYWRAQAYDGFIEYDKKIADFKKALELEPDVKDTLWLLGHALIDKQIMTRGEQKQQALKEAISVLTRLITIDPDYDVRIYKMRVSCNIELLSPDCNMAIEDSKHIMTLSKNATDDEYSFLARTYVSCKNYPEAIRTYEDILIKPKEFFTSWDKGHYALQLGKTWALWGGIDFTRLTGYNNLDVDKRILKKTIDVFDRVIKITSDKCDAAMKQRAWESAGISCSPKRVATAYKGLTQLVLGDTAGAMDNLKKSLKMYPHPTLKYHLAFILYAKKNYKQALENCKQGKEGMLPYRDEDFGNITCSDEFMEELNKIDLLGLQSKSKVRKK